MINEANLKVKLSSDLTKRKEASVSKPLITGESKRWLLVHQ